MIAVILAGGQSKRLRPLTNKKPKCLLDVAGKTLIAHQIEKIIAVGIKKIVVVGGFNFKEVEKEVLSYADTVDMKVINFERYAETNSIHGLFSAKEYVDDSMVLVNSDLYFDIEILKQVIDNPKNVIAIDTSKKFIDNEMFVNYDDEGRLQDISKHLTERVSGQAISAQIAKFSKEATQKIFKRIAEIIDFEYALYPVHAYDVLSKEGDMLVHDISGLYWEEIDTAEDYNILLENVK